MPSTRPAVFAEVTGRVAPSASVGTRAESYLSPPRNRQPKPGRHCQRPAGLRNPGRAGYRTLRPGDALARLARADERRTDAAARAERAEHELATLEEAQRRVAAEADDLEMRVRVVRDAQPLTPTEPASAEREAARVSAARSIASQARLLCTATRMLGSDAKEVTERGQRAERLDAQ